MDLTVYYNGELLNNTEVPLSIYDHGFLYGDGVKVDLRVYDRKPFLLKQYLKRFYYSLEQLKISISLTEKTIEKTIKTLLDLNCLNDALISLIVTRGEGFQNFSSNLKLFPHVLISTNPVLSTYDSFKYQGVSLSTSKFRAYPKFSFDHNIYTLSCQQKILSLYEAKNNGDFEGILINLEGQICETAKSSIFFVEKGKILTPDLECGVKNHVVRQLVMKMASKLNIPVFETFIPLERISNIDECFIVSLEAEILPVVKIDGHPIGEGRPGKLTNKLMTSYKEITKKYFFEDEIF